MILAFVRLGACALLLAVVGCGSSWRGQFPDGSKLYDKNSHKYFGKVVGFESTHDFHNGTPAQAAILIESTGSGTAERTWGACSTCLATFDVEKP